MHRIPPRLDPAPRRASPPPMLSVHNLRVEFGARVLFNDLTFSILPRERIAFAGHNGAGKSTLMKAIGGIVRSPAARSSRPRAASATCRRKAST